MKLWVCQPRDQRSRAKAHFRPSFTGISSPCINFSSQNLFFSFRISIFMRYSELSGIFAALCNYSQPARTDNIWKSALSLHPQFRNNGFCPWWQQWGCSIMVFLQEMKEIWNILSHCNVSENEDSIKINNVICRNSTITPKMSIFYNKMWMRPV